MQIETLYQQSHMTWVSMQANKGGWHAAYIS